MLYVATRRPSSEVDTRMITSNVINMVSTECQEQMLGFVLLYLVWGLALTGDSHTVKLSKAI